MTVSLTWDLLAIVFFAIVCSYSFIVGKHESVKIIIASYIAIVAVQGASNLVEQFAPSLQSISVLLGFTIDITVLSTAKLAFFVAAIIFLAIRGGFEMEYTKELGSVMDVALTAAFGFTTAGLLLSTLLTYVAGRPLLDPQLASAQPLLPILSTSQLMRYMVDYQNVWFSLPAFLLLLVGFLSQRES